MTRLLTYGIVMLGLLATGCSGWNHVSRADGRALEMERYAFQIPQGWTYKWSRERDEATISRDGPRIQQIHTRWIDYGRPLYTGDTERERLQRDMLPVDMAQLVVASRRRQLQLDSLEALALDPAVVAGFDGFRAEYRYRTRRGLRYRGVAYGSVRDRGLYLITFEAPELHYYERDIQTFEDIVASARRR